MQVRVYSPSLDIDRELREHVERRISFALDRVAKHVNWVGIRLGDLSNAHNTNKQCKVQISLLGGATLSVEQIDGNMINSVIGAADRAGKAVEQHLESTPTLHRSRAGDLGRFESPDENTQIRHLDRWNSDTALQGLSETEIDPDFATPGKTPIK